MFTKEDIIQIQEKGLDIKTVEKQIENFRKGFPFINLVAPATINNGIRRFRKANVKELINIYNNKSVKFDTLKLVPASGAATRMFKDLVAFYENPTEENEYISKFIENIDKFAFYDDLKTSLSKDNINIDDCIQNKDYILILDYLLNEKGLSYAKLPKALIKFHKYDDATRTPFEEHIVESVDYCINSNKTIKIHFTVAEEHKELLIQKVNNIKPKYESLFNLTFDISFSLQKPSTDIIAVDLNNHPVRDKNNCLVFRPGGHGALIENLNDCQADIIFIRNIDNIVPDSLKPNISLNEKTLGGLLINLYEKISEYLEMLEDNVLELDILKEIEEFTEKVLFLKIDPDYKKYTKVNKINYLYFLLNRPIRVCGMVRNTGEPGGGPFWVKETNGAISLQIVETSQVNLEDPEQNKIFKQSVYFNPVNLVCIIRDYKGKKFNLLEYIDESTGFISIKYKDGKEIKAQELPGLWNGAMADWITLFVDVPLITFNPVKTVYDLLRNEHQNII